MKVPEIAYEIPFAVIHQSMDKPTVIITCKDPEEMHSEFDKLDKTIPAYALNFGSILREQNI